jgi:hypothetical protein
MIGVFVFYQIKQTKKEEVDIGGIQLREWILDHQETGEQDVILSPWVAKRWSSRKNLSDLKLDEFLLENPLHLSGEKVDGSSRLTLDTNSIDGSLSRSSMLSSFSSKSPLSRSPLSRSPIHSQSGGPGRPAIVRSASFMQKLKKLSLNNYIEDDQISTSSIESLENTLLRSQKLLESLKSPNLL